MAIQKTKTVMSLNEANGWKQTRWTRDGQRGTWRSESNMAERTNVVRQ